MIIDDDSSLYYNLTKINLYIPDYHTGFTQQDIKKAIKQLKKILKTKRF